MENNGNASCVDHGTSTSRDFDDEDINEIGIHSALPSSTPDEKSEAKEESLSQRFKCWGPWRRWHYFREFQQHESQFERTRDPEENARGRLPDGENVQLPGIWVIELYTPSTVGGLLKGIRKLGWEYGRSREDSLTKWMNDVREGRQAGWVSLGLVSPQSAAHFMRERSAPLPEGVSAALPILMSLTPSITALVIAFLLDDDSAASLETSLRANFKTIVRRTSRFRTWHLIRYILGNNDSFCFSRSIFSPDTQRREALKFQLKQCESGCVQWVKKYFPGAFDSLPQSRLPTAVLLVTEKVRALSNEAGHIRALDGLNLSRSYDSWASPEWPGARLIIPMGWGDEGRRLTFSCRRHDAFPSSPGYQDPTSNWAIAQRADDVVQGLLSRWAITCLLDGYHETLSAMRDETARDGSYRTIRDLKKLRSFARTFLYDIGACTQELEEFSQSIMNYDHNVMEMSSAENTQGGKYELLKNLRSSQKRRAQQVRREATLLQATLSTSNDLSQTITNIRIQSFMIFLTVISIGIALWAGLHTP